MPATIDSASFRSELRNELTREGWPERGLGRVVDKVTEGLERRNLDARKI